MKRVRASMKYTQLHMYIYTHMYVANSRLLLYAKLSHVVSGNIGVLICCMSYVQDLVCAMCGTKSVSCVGFSLCYRMGDLVC